MPFYRARDRHCIECERKRAAERMRNRSPEHKRRSRDKWGYQTETKRRARELVRAAVRSGKIVKPTHCKDCGLPGTNLVAHHENYRRPLAVDWLHPYPCHARRHRKHA